MLFKKVLSEYWFLILILIVIPVIGFAQGTVTIEELLVRGSAIILCAILYLLFIRVLKVYKSGPLAWYATPLVWVGIPVVGITIYGIIQSYS